MIRVVLSLAGALAMSGGLAHAQPWSTLVSAETSYGYKDNLLLSAQDEERSAFVHGSLELMLLRLPTGRFGYSLYVQADRRHFFTGETIDHEAQAWVSSEASYKIGETLRFSLPVTGYYMDGVIDVSDTDVQRAVLELKEIGAMLGPTARWTFHRAWWLEAQALGQRRYYDDNAFNSTVGEGAVRLAWIPAKRLEIRASGIKRWRDFPARSQYNRAGLELVGTRLKTAEREGEVRLDVKWDRAAKWQTSTRASVLDYDDNGSGYFSTRERKIAQDVEWAGEKWLLRAGGVARRVDYKVQTVGFGFNPTARLRDEFSAEIEVERKLSDRWTIFAGYTWERSRSNDAFAAFVVNEGLLGARWSWDK